MGRKDCPYCKGAKCLELCKIAKSSINEPLFTTSYELNLEELMKQKKILKKLKGKASDKSSKKELKLQIKKIKKQIKKVKLTVAP